MDTSTNGYHISFFKPTTPQALSNRNMVIWFVLIWFIAIFGFQILLRIMEKPTPENSYISFEQVWDEVKNKNASESELQTFGQSLLSVLGKVAISAEERAVLDKALSSTLYQLTPDSMRGNLVSEIRAFEQLKASITSLSNETYIQKKIELAIELPPVLGLPLSDVRSAILPFELVSEDIDNLSESTLASIPCIMKKYLIHNQSVLTDMKFLGFPFHYFYTAVFLLILFIGMCYIYCVKIDKLNKKLEISEQ
jgi:putative solute:sodium symporter small subunit